MKKKGEDKMKR